MSKDQNVTLAIIHEVRDSCLCLHVRRAARAVARRYDDALRPLGLTGGQFSLLMALGRAKPWTVGEVAGLLGMDRTTVTANLKPLARRGLVTVTVDESDRRSRLMTLSDDGRKLLVRALPLWRAAQRENERLLAAGSDPDRLRADLIALV